MATEREIKKIQEELLFDVARLIKTTDPVKKDELIMSMYIRAQSGMTKEEIAESEKRAALMVEFEKGNNTK